MIRVNGPTLSRSSAARLSFPVNVGLALDVQGRPLCCEMWPGNTTDVKTLLSVVHRLKKRFGVGRICIVAGRGMISRVTRQALESKALDCDYMLGVRTRSLKEAARALKDRGALQEVYPERRTSKDPSLLQVKDVHIQGRRYVVCLKEEQRRKDRADRETIVSHLREALHHGDKALVGNQGLPQVPQNHLLPLRGG